MFDWLKDDPPDSWTPDRQAKVHILDAVEGDVEAAREAWGLRQRLEFVAFLVDHGRIGDGDDVRA